MDSLMLVAPSAASIGYDGFGDFQMDSAGRLTRQTGARLSPFVFAGVSIAHPRLFADAPKGAFSLNKLWDRAIARERLYGLRLDGIWMHVGTPEALAQAEHAIADSLTPRLGLVGIALMTANVFTLPPGVPFLEALARAILNGDLPAPGGKPPDLLSLPSITLLLPTRRAARAAREAFLAVSDRQAIIMPRIPADLGRRRRSVADREPRRRQPDGHRGPRAGARDKPARPHADLDAARRALAARDGRFRLGARAHLRLDAAQAAQLANELAKLMDDVERENVSLSGVKDLVPETYSEHWQKTVDFLKIVTEFWPLHLDAIGCTSPEARRNALILAEAERIAKLKPGDVVIVAGVTGSIPATVALMRAVAKSSSGAIVLPASISLSTTKAGTSSCRIIPSIPSSA